MARKPLSGKARRAKGAAAEREFFHLLNRFLPARLQMARRLGQARDGGSDGSTAHVNIEVKRQERLNLPAWLRQARHGSGGKVPVVAYRQNHGDWHCLVDMTPVQLAAYLRYRANLLDTENWLLSNGTPPAESGNFNISPETDLALPD